MRLILIIVTVLWILPTFTLAQECDYSMEILIQGTEFSKENFKWRMKATKLEGKSTNITATARIEDLNGTVIKNYKPWTNQSISKQKTSNEYSPNLNEGNYKIISEISVNCDDISKDNNINVKSIKIKSENVGIQEANTTIQQPIEENQEQQYAVQQKQENELINNPTINESQNNEVFPEYSTKEYENTANLRNEISQESSTPAAELSKSDKKAYAYVSSNEKARNSIIYFLLAISIVLNIVIVWKMQSTKNL